ncbi:MAG: hypothetical protein H7839_19685, partial [Magnetococcus sp. YQC-5]
AHWHFAHGGRTASTDWNRAVKDVQVFFEDDGPAVRLWRELTRDAQRHASDAQQADPIANMDVELKKLVRGVDNTGEILKRLAHEVAKIDGYDVDLRSLDIVPVREAIIQKQWCVPLRVWSINPEWRSEDGRITGSHDAQGNVRPEYIQAVNLYDGETLIDGLLDPDCIEARRWNLSAGQYKPFDFTEIASDMPVNDLIEELRGIEQGILAGLDRLQAMVEGRA